MRARAACIEAKMCDVKEERIINFDRLLMKIGEHTSGIDDSIYLHDW